MGLLFTVFSGFVLAFFAPVINRYAKQATGWLLALLPAAIFAWLLTQAPAIAAGEVVSVTIPWVPSLGVNLSFYLDGLALLMALLVSGIGALILIYGQGYLEHDRGIGRFFAYTLFFMSAMLGVVTANNLLLLFVFWELTSISSYLLIGYKHEYLTSRNAALQALLVTSAGGLAMFAGFIILSLDAGTANIAEIRFEDLFNSASSLYGIVLVLVLFGAFTKSAQFPFHFWLPNAMEAPTPVSAYLHSATMVKAGIYLLARMSPTLGGTDAWLYLLVVFGGLTMLLGAYLGWQQTDLKRILAYSTLSVLGTLTLLLGIGSELAVEAAMVFLLAHALYKGTLFMVAGSIDHETGTRNIDVLGGLRGVMPITFVAATLAALSMAGLPPFLGFIGKELDYDALLHANPTLAVLTVIAAVLANALVAVAAVLVIIKPFFGQKQTYTKQPHEPPVSMWLGPVLLAGLGLILGVVPLLIDDSLIASATRAITLSDEYEHLALWHGFTLPLGLSVITIGLAVGVYLLRDRLLRIFGPISTGRYGPEHFYEWSLDRFLKSADAITLFLQNGNLRIYLNVVISTAVLLVGGTFFLYAGFDFPINTDLSGVSILFVVLSGMIIVAAIAATLFRSRLAAIAMLGAVGYAMAVLFLLFGAPDLAMTQFAIETLSVVVIVLIIWKLPHFAQKTRRIGRTKDIIIAVSVGLLMTLLVLVVTAEPLVPRLSPYFAEFSYTLAKGENVVNVILVDFRGLDTLGEITVLAVAGIGVFVFSRLRAEKVNRPEDDG